MPDFKFVIAIDPGETNCGFCFFKYDPEKKTADTLVMQTMTPEQMYDNLRIVWGVTQAKESEVHFVVENFRVNSNQDPRKKMWVWDEVKTIRVIGAIELAANWCGVKKVILQEPGNVLPMARKWAPFKMAKHPKDDQSAWCHGVHFMMNRMWIATADQVTFFGQEKM